MKKQSRSLATFVKAKIKELIGTKNITQAKLAERMNTSQQALNKKMNKSKDIYLGDMEKVADSLGVQFTDLLPFNLVQNNAEESKEIKQVENLTINETSIIEKLLENQAQMMAVLREIADKIDKK